MNSEYGICVGPGSDMNGFDMTLSMVDMLKKVVSEELSGTISPAYQGDCEAILGNLEVLQVQLRTLYVDQLQNNPAYA